MAEPLHNLILEEVKSRARRLLGERWLVVDYYRIRRKLAFRLPVENLPDPTIEIRGIPLYPWDIWLLWTLEERLLTLGWYAEWTGDEVARSLIIQELEAFAAWPEFQQPNSNLLAPAHAGRILFTALKWKFISDALRAAILGSLHRLVCNHLPQLEERYAGISSVEAILVSPGSGKLLHNIPLIALCSISMAAISSGHSAASWLRERFEWVLEAWCVRRGQGASEGVTYDGYILDFAWDAFYMGYFSLPLIEAASVELLGNALALGAPGNPLALAELSDVEPVEMRFYLSAIAKHRGHQVHLDADWLFSHIGLDAIRMDGLASLHFQRVIENNPTHQPAVGLMDARYAVSLRRGWDSGDPSVAVGCNNWSIGHLHHDFGSVCIGRENQWFVTDAGYQQYMATSERFFTIGACAHNSPVLNGHFQTRKPMRREISTPGGDAYGVELDLKECYSPEAGVTHCTRTILLQRDGTVEVIDKVGARGSISYCWLGHRAAAWIVADDSIGICLPEGCLKVRLDSYSLSWRNLTRPHGSRGSQAIQFEHSIEGQTSFRWQFEWS